MGRLKPEFLERVEAFGDRMLDLAAALERRRVSRRILDQLSACGTSVGANTYEAHEAVSRQDFCKCIGISVKELSESRYWIRLSGRRGWVKPDRLVDLEAECIALAKILGTMLKRSRPQKRRPINTHS
jgi:four helix bundle protein